MLLDRPQSRLRFLARGGEQGIKIGDGSPRSTVPQLRIGDVVELDLCGTGALKHKKDKTFIRTPPSVAVTTFAIDRIDLLTLSTLAVIDIQIPETIIADGVVQKE